MKLQTVNKKNAHCPKKDFTLLFFLKERRAGTDKKINQEIHLE
jgi:hypothetical protein